jgi:hypothetical protein
VIEPEVIEPAVDDAVSADHDAAPPAKAAPPVFDFEAVEAAAVEAVVIEAAVAPKPRAKPKARAKAAEPKAPEQKAPEPSRAEGPWKAPRRTRRKTEAVPPAPWEGRFDTSRERKLHTKATPVLAPTEGTEPLAVCARHRGVLTRARCAHCGLPSCADCLVKPKGRRKAVCVECAIIESGVRKRRNPTG